jgi:hypothetical protein
MNKTPLKLLDMSRQKYDPQKYDATEPSSQSVCFVLSSHLD